MKSFRLGSAFETLEDRTVPATWGVAWPDPGHLTLSFVTDGTQTPVGTSSLDQLLIKAAGSVAAGEQIILSAFQAWAVQANINIGIVADDGAPLGTNGAVQGDTGFGDIRIAAAGLSPDSVANSSPFSFAGTTLAGDVILNSNLNFGVGNNPTAYDLYSVAIHEAGHVFGFGDITTPGSTSVMNQAYSYRTGLTASDIAAIQGLYGLPSTNAYTNNNSIFNPAAIPQASNGELLATGGLTASNQVEYFKFTAPLLTAALSGIEVRLKTEGLSLLTAQVTVYNAFGLPVASTQSTNPLNNDLTLTFNPRLFGGTFYIKVQGAPGGGVFDSGAFKLAVDQLSLGGILAPITTTVSSIASNGLYSTLATALTVQTNTGSSAGFDAIYRGNLTFANEVDTYRIQTSKFTPGTSVTLNVMVWGLDANPLDPQVRVFDANGNPVAFQILSNQSGLFSVQVLNAVAGSTYYVQVLAAANASQNTGDYFFAADFDQVPVMVFNNVANGTVTTGAATPANALTLTQAGAYQFALATGPGNAGDSVTMSVYDANGNLVFTLTAVVGQPTVTATEYLLAGTYYVVYSGGQNNAGPVNYGLFLDELTDLSGPSATTTASPPSGGSTTTSSSSSSSTSSSSSSSTSTTSSSSYSYSYATGTSTSKSTGTAYAY